MLGQSLVALLLPACGGDPSALGERDEVDAGSLAAAPIDAGGARDAATTDARATGRDGAVGQADAATDASATTSPGATGGCAGRSFALCEDFESAANGALPSGWSILPGWNMGTPGVTDAEHHGGTRALKSASATNGQPRASRALSELGALAGKHWGRVFYKVKTPAPLPAQGAVIHNTLVALKGSSESRVVDTVVNSQGKHQFLYNLPDDSCCGGSSYDYASYDGAWHCAEWYVDASTQTYRFYFEGKEVPSIGFSNQSPQRARMESFGAVVLGWINYQTPKTPYESWFDDLALDDARIGCE